MQFARHLLTLALLAACLDAQQFDAASPDISIVRSETGPAPTAPRLSQQLTGITMPASTPGTSWLDTSNRSLVATTYLNVFAPSSTVPTGWIGNVTTGIAGATSQAYQDAVLLRVNWFRQMAGVPTPITFLPGYSAGDQSAALMMSANAQLNHFPPSTWTFFTPEGADAAAHSNLCLEIPYLPDPGCVSQYMQDYGTANPAVGHRRWLLYPQTKNMGTGDVQPPFPSAFANALWVVDTHFYDARPLTRSGYVAWPPSGFVPYQIVPGRWSFSYPGADFSAASVTMQRAGGSVAVRLETPQTGFGENTLVWVPDNIDANVSTHWPQPIVDTPITVRIAHALVAGADTTFTYTVTIINPSDGFTIAGHIYSAGGAPLAGVAVNLSGGPVSTTDSAGAFQFAYLPAGTYLITPVLPGYVFSPAARSVSAVTAGADFAATACNYSGIGGAFSAAASAGTGTFTYNLATGCPWTVSSNAPWLVIDPTTTSGTGPISVHYSFSANRGTARTAVVSFSGTGQ